MTESYPIRAIAAEEFTALADVAGQAFLAAWPPKAAEYERQVTELGRTIAAFDGDEVVGTASAYTFTLTVPGAAAAASGITLVSVLPTYRRRGILSSMMNYLLADAAAHHEPLAILFASESGIYGRFGFGLATSHLRLRIGRGEGKLVIGEMAADEGEALMGETVEECRKVAAAEGFDPGDKNIANLKTFLTRSSSFAASMLGDLEKGGAIEGRHVIGDMLGRARKFGVAAPNLRMAYAVVQAYEARRSRDGLGKPTK